MTLMSKTITDELISREKVVKYYPISLDYTRNYNRLEEMPVILRLCNLSSGTIERNNQLLRNI